MARWVRGQSGNPNGRPRRGRSVAEMARLVAHERIQFDDDGEAGEYSRLERLVRVLWTAALDGDLGAARLLIEYMEGRPVEVVAASVEGRIRNVNGDELAALLRGAVAMVGDWRQSLGDDQGGLDVAQVAGLFGEGLKLGDEARGGSTEPGCGDDAQSPGPGAA